MRSAPASRRAGRRLASRSGVAILALGGWLAAGCGSRSAPDARAVTFNEHIAPIVFDHCVPCHRPEGAGPFSLITYRQVRKHASQIEEVTRSRFMPPWLPDPGTPEFVGARRLSDSQIDLLRRWVRQGAPEGDRGLAPLPPRRSGSWPLGEPDLVVEMPEAYLLPAEGFDVFRVFVLSVPRMQAHHIRAVDVQPGNPRVVHHAVLGVDDTTASRRRDALDPEPGFAGMDLGAARNPGGMVVGWTPGRTPYDGGDETSWKLDPGADLVLQLHMLPSGKPESIRPRVGLYFADGPPAIQPLSLQLYDTGIDIPAGERRYPLEDSMVLPVPVELFGLYPHAHYLGKDLRGFAVLPDGSRKELIRIRDWNFDWQDEYRFGEPVSLPAGTTLHMAYVYDNSAANENNPNHPPRRVRSGWRSTDEMGQLLFQLKPVRAGDRLVLEEAKARHYLENEPTDPDRHVDLGDALRARRRLEDAARHYREALKLDGRQARAHYGLAVVLSEQGFAEAAADSLRRSLAADPLQPRAHVRMGNRFHSDGELDRALAHYRRAVALDPDMTIAHYDIGIVLAALGDTAGAILSYRRAIELDPGHALSHLNLGQVFHAQGDSEQAARHYRDALDVDAELPEAHNNLGVLLAEQGQFAEAIGHYREALRVRPDFAHAHTNLGNALRAQGDEAGAARHHHIAERAGGAARTPGSRPSP